MTPLDLKRLAVRIENLERMSTRGWHPGDEMELKRTLTHGRGRVKLPSSKELRAMARRMEDGQPMETPHLLTLWSRIAHDLESMAQRNDPRNPRRMIRDMARGKPPFRR